MAKTLSLNGFQLFMAAFILAISNFVVVLDMTIVNVSVPHIAGGLAVSPIEGTYAITSYAVAEAITVPLTGWLASRFGTVKVFLLCLISFAICSAICGLSTSIYALVVGRLMQGLAGGPIMPLSQTLIMQIFQPKQRSTAIGIWSVTTIMAPILGPIVGGYISEHWTWHYIFLINIPIAAICAAFSFKLLKSFETPTKNEKIDYIGLILLILWVGSLQIVLDTGKNYNWFDSNYICILTAVAAFGFASFIIWELTEKKPIVQLQIFRHRGFTISAMVMGLTFGAYFASVVILPLWLQSVMDYSALHSGEVAAAIGCLAVFTAPVVAKLVTKVDARRLVSFGVIWLAGITFVRSFANTDMTMASIATPLFFQGIGLPLFFIPLNTMVICFVKKSEMASATGLLNFIRTLSGAFATSIVTSTWDNKAAQLRDGFVGHIATPSDVANLIGDSSPTGQQLSASILDYNLHKQMVMLATNQTFLMVAGIFALAAITVFFAPRPNRLD